MKDGSQTESESNLVLYNNKKHSKIALVEKRRRTVRRERGACVGGLAVNIL